MPENFIQYRGCVNGVAAQVLMQERARGYRGHRETPQGAANIAALATTCRNPSCPYKGHEHTPARRVHDGCTTLPRDATPGEIDVVWAEIAQRGPAL